jgi:hypothetical protein
MSAVGTRISSSRTGNGIGAPPFRIRRRAVVCAKFKGQPDQLGMRYARGAIFGRCELARFLRNRAGRTSLVFCRPLCGGSKLLEAI